jgi:hypothetical protein
MPPSRGATGRQGKKGRRKAPVAIPKPPGLIEGFLDFIGIP